MSRNVDMIIGEIISNDTPDGKPFLPVATIDLCDPGYGAVAKLVDWKPSENNAPVYFYGIDGNTKMTKDGNGKRLCVIQPQVVLEELEHNIGNDNYRRFDIALVTLKAVMNRFSLESIGVVFYEH